GGCLRRGPTASDLDGPLTGTSTHPLDPGAEGQQILERLAERRAADDRRAALSAGDQALSAQRLQSGAYGPARSAVVLHQLRLGRKRDALGQVPTGDLVAQIGSNLDMQRDRHAATLAT